MKKILTLTFVSFIALFLFLSNSSTPINGVTGSPGEINCYNCHSGGTGTTSVSFALNTSTPNEYKSDSTYIGTISVANPTYILGTNRWGFEISARDTLNNKVGTCTITNSVTTILATTTKDYVKHKNANINVGTKVWSFQFKMPAAATYSGKVTFYASGMACDGTGGTGGDKLKCDSFFYTKYNPLPDINVKQIATTYLNNSTFNYGNTFKNTNNDKVFTIENLMVGTVLNISNISITGTNASLFTIIGAAPSIVNGGSSSNITVRFTPTNAGAKTANLIINSDDPDENPYTIILNGTGTVSPPIATVKQKNNIINCFNCF